MSERTAEHGVSGAAARAHALARRGAADPRLPQPLDRAGAVQPGRLDGAAGADRDGERQRRLLRRQELRDRDRAVPPGAAGPGDGADRGVRRRPARPPPHADLGRLHPRRAVPHHPDRRHALVDLRGHRAGRGGQPGVGTGQGRDGAQPGAAAPARGRQPDQPRHHLRLGPAGGGDLRGADPRRQVLPARLRRLRRRADRPRALLQRFLLHRLRGRDLPAQAHPAAARPPSRATATRSG